jgi:hypothetical protein
LVLAFDSWYSPAAHPWHPEITPATDVYDPAPHRAHTVVPSPVWNVPTAQ